MDTQELNNFVPDTQQTLFEHGSYGSPSASPAETSSNIIEDQVFFSDQESTSEDRSVIEINTPENLTNMASIPSVNITPLLDESNPEKVWGNIPFNELVEKVDKIYSEIVFYRKNLFKVPSGKSGKAFIDELTYWMRQFNRNTKLNRIAIKVFMILPAILLQKPSAKSKAKQHALALERRLNQWRTGEIDTLMREIKMIQASFKVSSESKNKTENLSKRFAKFMTEGNVSAALKLLDSTNSTGMLSLTDEVMEELLKKHPEPAPITGEPLLHGPILPVPECFYDSIDEQTILKSAKYTKGSAGPSGMDADQFRRVLCSKNFNKAGRALREELVTLTKNLATKHYAPILLEAYVSCRLIPLDKDPGIRPIGIGEVIRRIIGKSLSRCSSEYIKEAAGPLQTCAGQGAGAEAAIHAMRKIFEDEGTDAVLLIDASNAFNRMNRAVALHNIQITCPMISTYLINTYRHPSKLFVAGGKTILSMEGTTQGDPLAMAWYSLSTTTLITRLHEKDPNVKQVWLADDASAAGKLLNLKDWYQDLEKDGKPHGYYVNGEKSWLIVKTKELESVAKEIFGDSVNITSEGKRHLGAVIGSDDYSKTFCEEKVNSWIKELSTLCEIAETHPQMAYSAYIKGYKSKFTHFIRTIENFHHHVSPIDELLSEQFIPTLFGLETPLPELRDLFCLNSRDGGLGIPTLAKEAQNQHIASLSITEPLVHSIIEQESTMRETNSVGHTVEDLKRINRSQKVKRTKEEMESVDKDLQPTTLSFVKQARDKGASAWLNALPIEDMNFVLNKEEFRDALRMRYNINLENLPSNCPCGQKFDVTHALSCKKGGFVNERHDNIKNTLTSLLTKVCLDVESEPHLIPVTNELFVKKTANTSEEARLDIKAKGFWQRGQTAFFDVRVTHVNSQSQKNQTTAKIFRSHEMAKKREYMERVLEVENGSFTPLVFGTNGGLGEECEKFLATLSSKIAAKDDESYSHTITWIRTRLSFEILRSAISCVRGSRVPFRRNNETELKDFDLMNIKGDMRAF